MRDIYLYIVAATLIFGFLMPQKGSQRKYYILLMTLMLIFVSGFRYQHLTGDLKKYHYTMNALATLDWWDPQVWQDGRNFGFQWLMKLVYALSGGNFQTLLFLISAIIHIILGYMVYRYSPAPWMSYLVWNCLSFYLFGFSAIKQSLAMAFVMLSFLGIAQRKPWVFFLCMAISGALHMPSLVFLPAYWLCRIKVTPGSILFFLITGILLYLFRDGFVHFLRRIYYRDQGQFVFTGNLGSRFVMILGFALFSIAFSGFHNPNLEKLFPILAVSTMLQIFSGYDHIFTRMADYYFQFSVLYLPMVFFSNGQPVQHRGLAPIFSFNRRSKYALATLVCIFLIWFYYTYSISITIENPVDDYLNYRFMWSVSQ